MISLMADGSVRKAGIMTVAPGKGAVFYSAKVFRTCCIDAAGHSDADSPDLCAKYGLRYLPYGPASCLADES